MTFTRLLSRSSLSKLYSLEIFPRTDFVHWKSLLFGENLALAQAVSKVSQIGLQYPEIEELDLNPVFLFEHGCAAADVRLVVRQSSERSSDR